MRPTPCSGQGPSSCGEDIANVLAVFAAELLLSLCALNAQAAAGDDPAQGPQALVDTVIAGIEANCSQIDAVQAAVEETLLDSTVDKEEIKSSVSSEGLTVSLKVAPKAAWNWRLYCSGDEVRRDVTEANRTFVRETIVSRDGVWTQYVPEEKTAWVRQRRQMPALTPLDIREWGSPTLNETVLDVLRNDRVARAEVITPPHEQTAVEVVTEGPRDTREWTFNPACGYLPVRWIARYDDGSIRQLVELTYQSVLDGTVWLPSEQRTTFFDKGVTTAPLEEKWRQCHTLRLTELVSINEALGEEVFAPVLPNGTIVRDAVEKREYVVGAASGKTELPTASRGWWVLVNLSGILAVVLVLCAVLAARRFKGPKSERRL